MAAFANQSQQRPRAQHMIPKLVFCVVQFANKLALAVDGFNALCIFVQRGPAELFQPLGHAKKSAYAFLCVDMIDIVAHAHRPTSSSMVHHLLSMAACLACLYKGGFAPSVIRLTLVMEAVAPWYKAMRIAKLLGARPQSPVLRAFTAGAIASNILIRGPFAVWLAQTLLKQMWFAWHAPVKLGVDLPLWIVLVAYCPLAMRLDLMWTAAMLCGR